MTARVLAGVSSLIGFVATGGYVWIIDHQPGGSSAPIWPWATAMGVAATFALVGAVLPNARVRRASLLFSAVLNGLLGLVALLSIGIVFLIAGLLALIAAALADRTPAATPVR